MKRYEALIILHNPPSDDAVKETVDALSAIISKAGGNVETVQKMDRKPFSRVASKKNTSGFYVNVIFEAPQGVIPTLTSKVSDHDQVFRMLLSEALVASAAAPAA